MASGFARRPAAPAVAFAATLVTCLWLDQGPPAARFESLSETARSGDHLALRAWMPLAFAYRRSADEELYYAVANAIRGSPYDARILSSKRGNASAAFERAPAPDGKWHTPYAEVPLEYPAVVLPLVLGPALISGSFGVFAAIFGMLMGALMLAAAHLAIRAVPDAPASDRAGRWWQAAALFLAQGGLLIQRVDALPALALALALWAAVGRRRWLFGLGIGLAGAAKILPILAVLPMMAADRDAWRTPRSLTQLSGGMAVGLAAGFLPMVALSPEGLGDFVAYHAARGLHVESTYGALLSLVELATGTAHPATLTFGSYNLEGSAARVFAQASSPLLVLAVGALTAWTWRRGGTTAGTERADAIARAGLSGLLCIWLFGKVFSPQYMTWGIPLALATSSRRPAAALGIAMAISQAYLRGFYDHVVDIRPLGVAALALRLVALGALAWVLLRPAPVVHAPSPAACA